MFQYAAGRALSLYRGVPFKLDLSGFLNYELHQGFELSAIFNCAAGIATVDDMREILGWRSHPFIRRQLLKDSLSSFRSARLVVEPHFQYWKDFKNLDKNSYLHGYWQSEQYFLEVADVIKSELKFKIALNSQNENIAKSIKAVESVSIHIRRGDYLSNPTAAAIHGSCSQDYYQSAIGQIADKVNDPHFFIFSDDIKWAKENLKMSDYPCQYVSHNRDSSSYVDMQLMSLCKHNIIANSSFSWWGAWLNSNESKIVIRPQKWFETNRYDVSTVCPDKWMSI